MASVRRSCLFLYWMLTVSFELSKKSTKAQGILDGNCNCSFPSFLQESCSDPSKTCRQWFQEIRLAHGGNKAFNKSTMNVRRTWVFDGGKVEVFETEFQNSHRSGTTVFHCWKKISPHIFIISSNHHVFTKNDLDRTFSCVRFRKRGRNIVEYEQSTWKDNSTSLACSANDFKPNDYPLIQTNLHESVDCPAELNGGFQIMQFYNGEADKQCTYHNVTAAVYLSGAMFESDCVGKEGLIIQLPTKSDCFLRKEKINSDSEKHHLGLLCHSTAWKDKHYTYFIVKHQTMKRNSFSDHKKSNFLCARFRKLSKQSREEIELQIYNQPSCWRNITLTGAMWLSIKLRRRTNIDRPARFLSEINETSCIFPDKFQGTWNEISQHNALQTLIINSTVVRIPPYGQFHCKTQHVFQHQATPRCNSLVTGKWPGMGRAKFALNDYLLVSNFSNGCRVRVTRFGITNVIGTDVLIYRLSQSVIVDYRAKNIEEYFNHHVLHQFCSTWLPYKLDPYPVWGRNIEKILMKSPMGTQHQCPLPTFGRGIYHFKSLLGNKTECNGAPSRMHFACDNSFTFEVKYDSGCHLSDVSFTCIGTAWRIGEFFLVLNEKHRSIECLWFDKENDQIFRLSTPQCSDIDWGKLPGEDRNFAEKFVFKYYSKCPVVSHKNGIEYPVIIRPMQNAAPGYSVFLIVIVITLALAHAL
ncbi:uncharacterized protein [Montipora foliosa]|uniref:uncharacterized protein n=1 Tax=Montipora foliosa TaxID=591990 RepID=UPI0035F1C995